MALLSIPVSTPTATSWSDMFIAPIWHGGGLSVRFRLRAMRYRFPHNYTNCDACERSEYADQSYHCGFIHVISPPLSVVTPQSLCPTSDAGQGADL